MLINYTQYIIRNATQSVLLLIPLQGQEYEQNIRSIQSNISAMKCASLLSNTKKQILTLQYTNTLLTKQNWLLFPPFSNPVSKSWVARTIGWWVTYLPCGRQQPWWGSCYTINKQHYLYDLWVGCVLQDSTQGLFQDVKVQCCRDVARKNPWYACVCVCVTGSVEDYRDRLLFPYLSVSSVSISISLLCCG